MQRLLPNHGTLWLHNDYDDIYYIFSFVCVCVCDIEMCEKNMHMILLAEVRKSAKPHLMGKLESVTLIECCQILHTD